MNKFGTIFLMAVSVFRAMFGLSACEMKEPYVIVDDMYYHRCYGKGDQIFFASSEFYTSGQTHEVHFIAREVEGFPVTTMGVVPYMFTDATPIAYFNSYEPERNIIVKNLYCPGSITKCKPNYLRTHFSDATDMTFRIYYCGAVVDLSEAGYGKSMIYYVPAEQLEEYRALWHDVEQDFWHEERAGEICAANIEYRLNAEDMETFYYIDHVESGNSIQNVPPEPTRRGYKFEGWYLDEDGKEAWDFSMHVELGETESLKLYAKWQENE